MIEFRLLKKSKKSRARLGILTTPHGEVRTPAFVTVATQGVVKTLSSEEVQAAGSEILIANTFHLHLKPGEEIVAAAGGLHQFMNWPRSLMTDSGGFQVFSLGFGRDLAVGKVLKYLPEQGKKTITRDQQPKEVKITSEGVYFRSPLDGKKLFLGPRESTRIQEKLGAEIIFAFDECTPPLAGFGYAKEALQRTHQWARTCLESKTSTQALFGIVQGSGFKKLRQESAVFIGALGFDGFGIGGDLGTKATMKKVLGWTIPWLDEKKPRHLLGIGHLEDIEAIIGAGVDLFDCTTPTQYARRGIAFTSQGRLNLNQSQFLKEKGPLDPRCDCPICQNYQRSYLTHLLRAEEMTVFRLLTFHNLYFFHQFVKKIREKIKRERI